MKKLVILLILLALLAGCEEGGASKSADSKKADSNQSSKKPEKLLACSVLSKEYLSSSFSGVIIVQLKEGGRTHPLCSARFKFNNAEYDVSLTLGVIGAADESYLESSVSYFKEKDRIDAITGAGEKAYNRTGGADQVSALSDGNLIHVSAYKNNEYDLEFTKKITNDMFKVLNK